MATNCGGGGANFRTQYLQELMKHTPVHSLGGCMHNYDVPPEFNKHLFADHGASQRNKIKMFQEYKFVLCFENNNVTDYVTEKLPAVFSSGALPVYMGAPNIDEWLPGSNSIIKTDNFDNAKELAEYINYLNEHDEEYLEYFEWKKVGLSKEFVDKYEKCVFYGADCRLCQKIAELKEKRSKEQARAAEVEGASYGEDPELRNRGYAFRFGGISYVTVNSDSTLNDLLTTNYTLSAWIKPSALQSMRIIDKNTAGEIDGFTFDIQPVGGHLFLRLCAGSGCFMGQRPLSIETWYYVTAVFSLGNDGIRFYVNGFHDVNEPSFQPTRSNTLPLRFGYVAAGPSGDFFAGKIDDVSIWSVVLSQEDITRNSFRRFSGNEIGLIGYWSFNEGSGTVVHDWSRLHHHGQITESELSGWEDADFKPIILNRCW